MGWRIVDTTCPFEALRILRFRSLSPLTTKVPSGDQATAPTLALSPPGFGADQTTLGVDAAARSLAASTAVTAVTAVTVSASLLNLER